MGNTSTAAPDAGLRTSGLAHDINNALTGLLCAADLAQAALPPNAAAQAYLDDILGIAGRLRELTAQLVSPRDAAAPKRRPLALAGALQDALRLVQVQLPEPIRLTMELPQTPVAVWATESELFQVILNLCVNAVQAMNGTGRLHVAAEAYTANHAGGAGQPERRVRLWVRDSGSGMDAATMAHMFDPYFTTKPRGEGTGLGLAVVRQVVEDLAGRITADSRPGRGTVFCIELPAAPVPVEWHAPKRGWAARSAGKETTTMQQTRQTCTRSIGEAS